MLVDKKFQKVQLIVLKPTFTFDEAEALVEKKKTNPFRKFLKKPDKSEVHVRSVDITYEPYMKISGRYAADFYRKAIHSLKVDHNVREIKIANGTFPISEKSTFTKKLEGKYSKNTVEVDLEEHVFVETQGDVILDQVGIECDVSYKLDSKMIENYPDAAIEQHKTKDLEITADDAIKKFSELVREEITYDVRDLNEKLTIEEIIKLYVPIYETRLEGPEKKVRILRIDGVTQKEI